MVKNCEICDKEYEAQKSNAKYCSAKCKAVAYRKNKLITKTCEFCGETYEGYTATRFCSKVCSSKYMHNMLEEKILSCVDCGLEFLFEGTTVRLRCDACRKIHNNKLVQESAIRTGKVKNPGVGKGGTIQKGKLHPSFKTGIGIFQRLRKEFLQSQGKEIVCEECGSDANLEVHHLNQDRTDNNIDNLKLLCKKCHKKYHIKRDELGRFI